MNAPLASRIHALTVIGIVTAVDFQGPSVRVRCKIGASALLTDWLHVMADRCGQDRSAWAPTTGEQVVILSPGGDLGQGLIIGSLPQDDAPAPALTDGIHRTRYGDGAVIEYDRTAHRLRVALPAEATVRIEAPGGVQIVGDLKVTGRIESTGDQTAAEISQIDHTHLSGEPGTPTGSPIV